MYINSNVVKAVLRILTNEKITAPNDHGDIQIRCPFPEHDDQHSSFSINMDTGLYKCFGCNESGSLDSLVSKLLGVDRDASEYLISDISSKVIKSTDQQKYNANLSNSEQGIDFLKSRGINEKSIEKYGLGWNAGRITIPIKNIAGDIVNMRMHAVDQSLRAMGAKVISYGNGFGTNRIFPIENLLKKNEKIYICEGELDAILLNQNNIPAITCTSGAMGWRSHWSGFFKNKEVILLYDNDNTGFKGAQKTAGMLPEAKTIKIVDLGLDPSEGKDVTDFLNLNPIENLINKIEKTPILQGEEENQNTDNIKVNLAEAVHKDFMNEKINFNGQIIGKDLTPYIIPWTIDFNCDMSEGEQCEMCQMSNFSGSRRIKMTESDILNMVGMNQQKMITSCYKKATSMKCKNLKLKVRSYTNVEKLFVTPPLDYSLDAPYVVREVYYIGMGIQTNATYNFNGKTLVDPKNQKAIIVSENAIPEKGDIDKFEITDEVIKDLLQFNPDENQSVQEKYHTIIDDLESVTKIIGRRDIIGLMDLAFHTPIHFNFLNKEINKGWSDLLILGDTRTGKSEIATSLIKFFKMGEFVSGENASFAGLVGGMQQFGKEWVISWGKIPLNDRRLVIVDEASGLNPEIIGALSSVRSSGIAEITKIQSESTLSRTRVIWLSNPRNNKNLSSYMYPVTAAQSIFERPEDIARLDTIAVSLEEDVDRDLLNERINFKKLKINEEAYRKLLTWAWTRKSKDIKFTNDAVNKILEVSGDMGEKYSSKIPIVQTADQKYKIAKYSIALATRLFSTDKTGNDVIVKEEHVDYVVKLFEYIMKKNGYEAMSDSLLADRRYIKGHMKEVLEFMNQHQEFIEFISRANSFKPIDIQDLLDFSQSEARALIKFAVNHFLLKRTGSGLIKTKEFVKLLKTEW